MAVVGLDDGGSDVVEYLAACGVRRWQWLGPVDDGAVTLAARLQARHGSALNLQAEIIPAEDWSQALNAHPPDLLLSVGTSADLCASVRTADRLRIPALLVVPHPPTALAFFPGDDVSAAEDALRAIEPDELASPWQWFTAAPMVASLARVMLLRDTPFARADLAQMWRDGIRVVKVGDAKDPLTPVWTAVGARGDAASGGAFSTPVERRGSVLIVGLGSLGSVAAQHLLPAAKRLVLVDPDRVDAYNPARQAYSVAGIGRPKAAALAKGLHAAGAAEVVALDTALTDEDAAIDLIRAHNITAVLVVTGTGADFAIARALRRCDVPHVVGRCYPRARYWEAILVDGARGPSLEDFRGHVVPGPPAPLTPEQRAAYSDAGALEAEPATLIESGWAAVWMARLAAQFLAPSGLREAWFWRLLSAGQTCLVGGVGVEQTPNGPAYGISRPGQILAWGQAEVC